MRAPEFDVVGWLKDLSPIVLTVDIDLAYLCILGLAGYPDNEEEYFDNPPLWDFGIVNGDPWLLSWQDSYGRIYTEEVSETDYINLLAGNGYKPTRTKPLSWPYTPGDVYESLEKLWDERVTVRTITIGDDEDHIIRSEN